MKENRLSVWLVISTSSLVSFLFFGLTFSFGSLLIPLLNTFNRDRASTATIVSLHVGVSIGFGIISGVLIRQFGLHRVALISTILVTSGFFLSFFATSVEYLYVTLGIVTGIGHSMGFLSSVVAISRVSSGSKRLLFLSIQMTFVSISGMAVPYWIKYLDNQFGLRGTFLILSAIQGNVLAFCVVCLINKDKITDEYNTSQSPQMDSQNRTKVDSPVNCRGNIEINNLKSQTDTTVSLPFSKIEKNGFENVPSHAKTHSWTLRTSHYLHRGIEDLKSIMSEIKYTLHLCSSALTLGTLTIFVNLIVDICLSRGFSYDQGTFLYLVCNTAIAITRLVVGVIKQRPGISVFVFPFFATLLGCVVGFVMLFGRTYIVLVVGTSIAGITAGANASSLVMVAVKLFPQKLVPVANGLQYTCMGITAIIAGPIFGKLIDLTGSYNSVFMTISAINAIGFVLNTAALILRRRDNKKNSERKPSVYVITKL